MFDLALVQLVLQPRTIRARCRKLRLQFAHSQCRIPRVECPSNPGTLTFYHAIAQLNVPVVAVDCLQSPTLGDCSRVQRVGQTLRGNPLDLAHLVPPDPT